LALEKLGNALRDSRPEEALQVLEASLALNRRYWSHDEDAILIAQANKASCLAELGRHDEAFVLDLRVATRLARRNHSGRRQSSPRIARDLLPRGSPITL